MILQSAILHVHFTIQTTSSYITLWQNQFFIQIHHHWHIHPWQLMDHKIWWFTCHHTQLISISTHEQAKRRSNKCESRRNHKSVSVSNPRASRVGKMPPSARALPGWHLEKHLGDGSSSRENGRHVRRWTEKLVKAGAWLINPKSVLRRQRKA